MKVLVYGSGGREHALYWKLKQSNFINQVDCYPGNGGINDILDLNYTEGDIVKIVDFLSAYHYNLLVPGPEEPLVEGIVNICKSKNINAFGPTKEAAMLEGSKVFAKQFMAEYGIPTARFKIFDDFEEAKRAIIKNEWARVVKADGLAAGKGVFVCNSEDEAIKAAEEMMVKEKFKEKGKRIVLEKKLKGKEISYIVFTDGDTFKPMLVAQDHKPALDNDEGKNTGGMGAYAPVPFVGKDLEERIQEKIVKPTIMGMKKKGTPFIGSLYFGLMITAEGPMLLEYNCRFGDPETQPILPLLKTDLAKIMLACINGHLDSIKIEWENKYACCVVLASGSYPDKYETGKEISGLDKVKDRGDIIVFHAGTKKKDGKIFTDGGRVLGVTGIGNTLKEARDKAYFIIGEENNGIWFEDMHYRKDIALKGLEN